MKCSFLKYNCSFLLSPNCIAIFHGRWLIHQGNTPSYCSCIVDIRAAFHCLKEHMIYKFTFGFPGQHPSICSLISLINLMISVGLLKYIMIRRKVKNGRQHHFCKYPHFPQTVSLEF